jgi:hypothetical protein
MGFSGIGVIVSGDTGIVPTMPAFKYFGHTSTHQLPYPTDANIANPDFQVSATEEKRFSTIVDNQLQGIYRLHGLDANADSYELFSTFWSQKHNYAENTLIVQLESAEVVANNIFYGSPNNASKLVWSGLDHNNWNYLYASMVEQPTSTVDYKSSRELGSIEARFTTVEGQKPEGPENSVLLGAFKSGIGINFNPNEFRFLYAPVNHADENQNPHGLKLFQNKLVVSGITILNKYIWNYSLNSGLSFSGNSFGNITYLNDLLIPIGTTIVTSGLYGNILSGNLRGTFFESFINMNADPATVGYMTVNSGFINSGYTLFRNNVSIASGNNGLIDYLKFSSLIPQVAGNTINSGNSTNYHTHSLNVFSGISEGISPKYPHIIHDPNSVGFGSSKSFEYNTDLGNMQPTLRHKGRDNGSFEYVYIRKLMPANYNTLDSVNIQYKNDTNLPATMRTFIMDCNKALWQPSVGFELSSSGIGTQIVSGFPQTNFVQNKPFDLIIQFTNNSGLSQYLGDIVFNFQAK